MPDKIPNQGIEKILKISRATLAYWRKKGLINGYEKNSSTRGTYSFPDLVTLRTIQILRKNRISLQQIRAIAESFREKDPSIKHPFAAKTFLAFGKKAVIVHNRQTFEALSGQALLFDAQAIRKEMKEQHRKEAMSIKRRAVQKAVRMSFSKNQGI